MIRKKYKSFDEIDQDLKILKLKREIDYWSMKNDAQRLQQQLSPSNLKNSVVGLSANLPKAKIAKVLAGSLLAFLLKKKLSKK